MKFFIEFFQVFSLFAQNLVKIREIRRRNLIYFLLFTFYFLIWQVAPIPVFPYVVSPSILSQILQKRVRDSAFDLRLKTTHYNSTKLVKLELKELTVHSSALKTPSNFGILICSVVPSARLLVNSLFR